MNRYLRTCDLYAIQMPHTYQLCALALCVWLVCTASPRARTPASSQRVSERERQPKSGKGTLIHMQPPHAHARTTERRRIASRPLSLCSDPLVGACLALFGPPTRGMRCWLSHTNNMRDKHARTHTKKNQHTDIDCGANEGKWQIVALSLSTVIHLSGHGRTCPVTDGQAKRAAEPPQID